MPTQKIEPSSLISPNGGRIDYIYRGNGENIGAMSPREACEEGCKYALSQSNANYCYPLIMDKLFQFCEAKCEALIQNIYKFQPTETDCDGLYKIIGFGIGKKILEKDLSSLLRKCPLYLPVPAPAAERVLNLASSENKITKCIEEVILVGAMALLTYSIFNKIAWLSKVNVGATLVRGELKYAKVPAFSNALAGRAYFLKA